ncbi:DNA-methyltransferase [Leptothoe sp. PORK10 BA2]|uniref:DNA-methyltransferase n=1 Tax=Leptothoe sp. PORK10 BA2 TaxID=3110254 RepID=UPI002B2102F5|nr:site-specific DNA-methyltransferase [Leptothoe sp. PORK10 BA2]MEA5465291.1 site-specific DNA-methyltransferase [Leptothoe sp. PORK10 BA2]
MTQQLIEGESVRVLAKLLNEGYSWHYCVTSPPYFSQIDYGHGSQIGLESTSDKYIKAVAEVFNLIYQGMDDGGVMWLNIQDTISGYSTVRAGGRRQAEVSLRRKPEHGYRPSEPLEIPSRLVAQLREQGWILIERQIWDKGQSSQPHRGQRTGSCHEDILVLGKSRYSRPRFGIRADTASVLPYPPIKTNKQHPCQMPLALAKRFLWRTTKKPATVIDPFCGYGTSLWAAQEHGHESIGIDLDITAAKDAQQSNLLWLNPC